VANYGIAVVMPNVHKSFYSNMKFGDAYWDYISKEIPAKVSSMFQVSTKREDTYVAGLSMGGYGAFKLALRCPDRFCAAASLSGALDIGEEGGLADIRKAQFGKIFGNESVYGTEDDLFYLLDQFTDENIKRLKFYQCCGTEDFLYQDNIRFRDYSQRRGIDHIYEEEAGSHNWEYWDYKIQRVLDWMFSKG
jgi:S-formylglutathione hydrolase FrmB